MSDNPKAPASWLRLTLGDVVEYGRTVKIEPSEIPVNAWVLELEDIEKDTSQLLQRLTFAQRLSKSTKNKFTVGDVLYGKLRPYLNKVLIADQAGYCTTEIVPIKPNIAIDGHYLFYWFKHPEFLSYVDSVSHGIQMPRLGTEAGLKAPLILAPLNEQPRIVAKLDTLFTHSRRAREELARIPKLIERYKQAVLAAALRGDLTADWREKNLASEKATDLLIQLQHQQRIIRDHSCEDLPSNWCWAQVEEMGDVFLGRQRSPKNHTGSNMKPYVRAANITWNGWELSDIKEMNFDERDFRKYKLKSGDVLINEGSGSADEVGKPAIWNSEIEDCCFQNTLICVRPFASMSQYLYFVFLHAARSKTFVEETRGVNIFHIGKERLSQFKFALPPLTEQKEIVKRIEILFNAVDRMGQEYQKASGLCDRLEQATLSKAFRGELVPQNPEDEPASMLLERILAEKSAAPSRKKHHRQ